MQGLSGVVVLSRVPACAQSEGSDGSSLKIVERGQLLIIEQRASVMLAVGVLFAGGGVIAIVMSWLSANAAGLSIRQRLGSIAGGLANVAMGGLAIWLSPNTVVHLDRATGQGLVRTSGIARRTKEERFALAEIVEVELVGTADGDGDVYHRLRLSLSGGRRIWLQTHGEFHSEESYRPVVEHMKEFLALPAEGSRRVTP